MACDIITRANEIGDAYRALTERCCDAPPLLDDQDCLVPWLQDVYAKAIQIEAGYAGCRDVTGSVARPAMVDCLSDSFLVQMRDWIAGLTCGGGPQEYDWTELTLSFGGSPPSRVDGGGNVIQCTSTLTVNGVVFHSNLDLFQNAYPHPTLIAGTTGACPDQPGPWTWVACDIWRPAFVVGQNVIRLQANDWAGYWAAGGLPVPQFYFDYGYLNLYMATAMFRSEIIGEVCGWCIPDAGCGRIYSDGLDACVWELDMNPVEFNDL